MYKNDIDTINNIALGKYNLAKKDPIIYLLRAIMAGFYLVVAIILAYVVGAASNRISPELAKIATAMTFSVALGLIIFLGGELFTGNNMTMAISFYDKKCKWNMVLKVWTLSYLGNLIGNVFISFIFVKSGASIELLKEFLAPIIEGKLVLSNTELILRGILCNFIVCIAVLVSIKMKTEIGKLTMMFWCIFAFVVAGFEHSIANMGIFSIAYFSFGYLPIGIVLNSMFWVTLGNIIGGAILYGFTLYKMAE